MKKRRFMCRHIPRSTATADATHPKTVSVVRKGSATVIVDKADEDVHFGKNDATEPNRLAKSGSRQPSPSLPMPPKAEAASETTSLLLNNNRYRENNELDHVLPGADGRTMVNDAFRHTRCNHCRTAWQRYNNIIGQHPLIVKSITAMFILGAGDLCGQGVEHLRGQAAASVDLPRMARFAIFGLFGAPWSHYYFYFLDHYLPPSPKPCSFRTLVKVIIDQGIQAPLLLAVMISSLSFMKGEGLPGMQQDLVRNYWDTLLANWKLWIPFSVINIAFVKPTLRVLFVNCVFLVWTVILSLMLNSSS